MSFTVKHWQNNQWVRLRTTPTFFTREGAERWVVGNSSDIIRIVELEKQNDAPR